MEFWRYYRIIRRRRWLIILGMLVCVGAVEVNNLLTVPLYRAHTTVMESGGMTQEGIPLYPEPYMQLDLQLRLSNLSNIATSQRVLKDAAATLSDLGLKFTADEILRRTSVQPVRDTNILAIEVTLPDGREAKVAADVMADEFKKIYGELNNAAVSQSREFIEEQIATTKQAMVRAQDALRKFKEEQGIVLLDAQSQAAIQRVSQAKVDNNTAMISLQRAGANLAKIEKEHSGILEMVKASETTAREPLWSQLTQDLALLETAKAAMIQGAEGEQKRGPNHPDVIAIARQVEEIKNQTATKVAEQYVAAIVQTRNPIHTSTMDRWILAKVESVAADAQCAGTATVLGKMQSELGELPAKEAKLAGLKMDVTVAVQTHGLMISKLDEAKIREQQANAEVALKTIDAAYVTEVNQREVMKLVLALVLSPLLGVGVAFLLHYTDNTVKTPADAENLLGLPVLSVIPGARGHSLPRQKCPEILEVAYQMLTSNLWMAKQNQDVDSVVMVSAEPDVGRSVSASNLAVSLANEGARVVLVDADLRQPTQHLIFGVDNKVGLTNVVSGGAALEDVAVPTKVQGLLLVPTGPVPDNPVKLLRSTEMRDLVDSMKELADFVIYDTPAGVAFPDAVLVASYVGNAVVVHSAGRVPRGSETEFRSRLEAVGVRLLGTVLNKVRREDSSSYFHYHRSYQGVGVAKLASGKKAING